MGTSFFFRISLVLFFFCLILRRLQVKLLRSQIDRKRHAQIVVLGDIGRSPRMQYHALSLLQNGFSVDILGFAGAEPFSLLTANNQCQIHYIKSFPPIPVRGVPGRILLFPYAVCKVIFQTVYLFVLAMFVTDRPQITLVQNPPAIPTLLVLSVVNFMRKSRLIIDWHNLGFSVLAMKLGQDHLLVSLSEWYEKTVGRFAYAHLAVTDALKAYLASNFVFDSRKIHVLHDRPPQHYKSLELSEKTLFLEGFSMQYLKENRRLAAEVGKYLSKQKGTALLVSSTSWTEDENFHLLLEALDSYDKYVRDATNTLPNLLVFITGKGPMKDYYEQLIVTTYAHWEHVIIHTLWLKAEDYPRLLGCCDLGISLHTSSSGLDLPMKIVDMFGCGLPVAAVDFSCLGELVKENINGVVFSSPQELFVALRELFTDFMPFEDHSSKLKKLSSGAKEFQNLRWEEQWNSIVLPVITK